MSETYPKNPLGLPDAFYAIIRPYIDLDHPVDQRQVADTPEKILTIWRGAVEARNAHPKDQELIAEWTVSAAASSILINDNDVYEDIHQRFGVLEVPANDSNLQAWEELGTLLDTLPRT